MVCTSFLKVYIFTKVVSFLSGKLRAADSRRSVVCGHVVCSAMAFHILDCVRNALAESAAAARTTAGHQGDATIALGWQRSHPDPGAPGWLRLNLLGPWARAGRGPGPVLTAVAPGRLR
jgi:hypothetical protein